ncbi:MAG: ABC transporter ATP-binding protein [Actinobacteria bacterium]|nr:ABC transporter ATP-binding protein [Actinomycetota bacterium]
MPRGGAPVTSAIELRGIVKRFPGVVANSNIDLELRHGEVHALLGENGAGKSTLMSVLAGIYQPDAGSILIDGEPIALRSPRDAIQAGIAMVHQHFRLVKPFTVAENVLLGARTSWLLSPGRLEAEVADLAQQAGLKASPSARIWQLSVGEQQRVEILKALYRKARVLILDEPTAVLTPQEAEALFVTLRSMAADGRTVVFVSHKLSEVMSVADRITVLRGGKHVGTLETASTDEHRLAHLMVGRDIAFESARAPGEAGEIVLRVDDLHALSDLGLPAVRGASLSVRAGEILGLAGVAGNGQRELAEALAGTRPPTRGRIELYGADLTRASARRRIEAGLAYVPEDRLGTGLVGAMDATANVMLKSLSKHRRGPLLDYRSAARRTKDLVEQFGIKMSSLDAPVRLMSGGNLQKLLLARELSSSPRVVIAAHPTAGLDVGATEAVHELLLEQRASGVGILLISEDLDELLMLSDRIAVMYEGEIAGEVSADDADLERIGLMMGGTGADAPPMAAGGG